MTEDGVDITLTEWDTRHPTHGSGLEGRALRDTAVRELAEELARLTMLEVTELRTGLMVRSFAHVGKVRLGDLHITVTPKLHSPSLLPLLRYAYGLRKLRLLPASSQQLDQTGFVDVLVHQLIAEVRELLARGLYRTYVPKVDWLPSPRGRINLQRLAVHGGSLTACLPCTHHPRVEDSVLNQLLLAGLRLAGSIASDIQLRREVRRLAGQLEEGVSRMRLNTAVIERVRSQMNRLTASYEPAITIIHLLWQSHGIVLGEHGTALQLPGFLFDMNRFFQALLARFLRENVPEHTVRDEYHLRGMMQYATGFNPRHRRPPMPRPDFAVLHGTQPVAILDAKYRDLWERPLPRDMLYQLAIYATSHAARSATILYPTTDKGATEARIHVQEPLFGRHIAQVSLRPVILDVLRAHVEAEDSMSAQRRRRAYATWLALGI